MPGIFFTNALMLAGLTALAIPVVIHLLLKRKKKRLRFSTLLFFLKQDEQSSRRRKLRHWLLLSLRLLIFILLVLAFARPYLPENPADGQGRRRQQAIFVVDRSASMQALGSDGPRWIRAKERAQKILAELKPDDRAALIGCSSHSDVISGFAPPASIAKTLADLQPTFGTSNAGEGLRQAVKLVSLGDPSVHSTIYMVSDLQRSACQNLSSYPLPQEIEFKLLEVGDLISPNLAINQLEVESRDGAKPQAIVASFSDEDAADVTLDLSIDGQGAFSRSFSLKSGASTNLDLAIPGLKPGWHDVKAALRTKDALETDNARYASLFVPEPTRILVVESRKTRRLFEEETFFIATALDPTKDSTNSVPGAYNLTKITPEELVNKVSADPGQRPYDVVILPGLKQVPSGAGRALTAFVQAGGGLVLFLGEEISANRYNNEFRDLLPAQLGNPEPYPDLGSGWRISEFDTNTTAFAAFGRPNSGDLHIPQFNKRCLLTTGEGASQLALFDDALPLIVTRALGQGRVALVNTSADASWTDWPKHKTFVPWLHGLGKHLVQKAGPDRIQETNSFVAGDDFEIELGSAAAKSQFKLQPPGGKEKVVTTDDMGRLHDADLAVPGNYSLRDPAGQERRRISVNSPAQESDLTAMPSNEFQLQLVRVQEPQKTTLAAGLFGSTGNQKEFWRVLLLGVLALLFIEIFAANRTLA